MIIPHIPTEEEMNEIWQDATPEEQLGILAEDADAAWEEALLLLKDLCHDDLKYSDHLIHQSKSRFFFVTHFPYYLPSAIFISSSVKM